MAQQTNSQYKHIIDACREVFMVKMKDYGTAWRILRPSSLTDQIFIKAQRIRSIQEKKNQRIAEGIEPEFTGIINYSIMALIQLELGSSEPLNLDAIETERLYKKHAQEAQNLMSDKNHDYSEAWREMRVSSLTDIILMKLLRIKQIENNAGKTEVSEGLDANYLDIINYAVFARILLMEELEKKNN
ncbi:MAG: DUF1599 domain-containing protein [Bacteroidales bacterium]|jgi:hypothetical protein|nr:DUF1599 domain-containing protein [Bacteroidales bacterium]